MKLYNTLTRSLQPFEPLRPPSVSMYVCGPTVYDVPHIGHARSAYIFDMLRRYLASREYDVTFIRNVTDVDDKIIERAKQELGTEGTGPGARDLTSMCQQVTERYLVSYHEAMDRLGIERPTEEPHATQHVVPEMTDFIAKLLVNGVGYEAGGDVYFSVRKATGYGGLSNRTLDGLQAGARVEPGEHKQDPLDFALWKAAKPGEPSWKSPWGPGRPGWHIECSTMSTKYLGDAFDIHGGGVDLVFPHHENELAQAREAGKPFARYWVHNGLLTVNGEKMSKSLGNYITVEQALADYSHPDYLKLFFLKTHYRSPIDYSEERMVEAKKNFEEFDGFFKHYDQATQGVSPTGGTGTFGAQARERFVQAMDDDLNTPQALAALFDLVNAGHRVLESSDSSALFAAKEVHDALIDCGAVLGLFQKGTTEEDPNVILEIERKIQERDVARRAKDYDKADVIRSQLMMQGILLTDTKEKTLWRRISR